MKKVLILRGVPGCGKSTLAEFIKDTARIASMTSVVCTADDFFMKEGKYEFDFNKLGLAHKFCEEKFKNALDYKFNLVIVANTSTRERDVNTYRKLAIEADYEVTVLTVENWHDGVDVHNVPEEAKINMKKQLLTSIKL